MAINIDILNSLIKNQKDAIRYHILFAFIVILFGICLIIFSSFTLMEAINNETLKLLLSIGGGFISTISAYPINQIITRKEKIKTYNLILSKLPEMTKAELKRTEELIWQSVEKIL